MPGTKCKSKEVFHPILQKCVSLTETFANKEVVFMGFTTGTDAGNSIASWVTSQGAKIVKKVHVKEAKNTIVIHKSHKSVIDKIEKANELNIPIFEYLTLLKKIGDGKTKLDMVKQHTPKDKPDKSNQTTINPSSEDLVKQKVHKFVEQWKQQQADKYVDESHKLFCETGESSRTLLKKPVVNFNASIRIPLWRLQPNSLTPKLLDAKKLPFQNIAFTLPPVSFNNYSVRNIIYKNLRQSSALSHFEDMIDVNWIKLSNDYIYNTLTQPDLFTLIGYYQLKRSGTSLQTSTYNELLTLSRNTKNEFFPYFFQALETFKTTKDMTTIISQTGNMSKLQYLHSLANNTKESLSVIYHGFFITIEQLDFMKFWKPVIDKFYKHLDMIIRNAPATQKKMIVYEFMEDKFGTDIIKVADNLYKSDIVKSTSLSIVPTNIDTNAKIRRITILPGSRVLLFSNVTSGQNLQILVSSDSKFYVIKHKHYLPLDTNGMCPNKSKKYLINDVVLIK